MIGIECDLQKRKNRGIKCHICTLNRYLKLGCYLEVDEEGLTLRYLQ